MILEVEAPRHLRKTAALKRCNFTYSFIFFLFQGVKSVPHYLLDVASGTCRAPKWTRIELQVINLQKAPLEYGAFAQAFVFICQDMYIDMRR